MGWPAARGIVDGSGVLAFTSPLFRPRNMPTQAQIAVSALSLDLRNFRTVPQVDELGAVRSMIAVGPTKFWALMESLIADGYHATENIIVLRSPGGDVVKEGNRRIAALKLIFGLIDPKQVGLPSHLYDSIASVTQEWIAQNTQVPCAIFAATEEVMANRIVSLIHGKSQSASRDDWGAVPRARHLRDTENASEPG